MKTAINIEKNKHYLDSSLDLKNNLIPSYFQYFLSIDNAEIWTCEN